MQYVMSKAIINRKLDNGRYNQSLC